MGEVWLRAADGEMIRGDAIVRIGCALGGGTGAAPGGSVWVRVLGDPQPITVISDTQARTAQAPVRREIDSMLAHELIEARESHALITLIQAATETDQDGTEWVWRTTSGYVSPQGEPSIY
jgi:hypothetical protein